MRIDLIRAVCHGFFTVVRGPKLRVSGCIPHVSCSYAHGKDSEIVIALFSQNVIFLTFVDCPNKNKSQSYPRNISEERETRNKVTSSISVILLMYLQYFLRTIQQSYINNNYLNP